MSFAVVILLEVYVRAMLIGQGSLQGNGTAGVPSTSAFDPFVTAPNPLSAANAVGPVQANPFSHDTAAALNGAAFFANQSGFQQPVSHFLSVVRKYPNQALGPISHVCPDWAS